MPLPLPSLAEQAAIVERVEAIMATCHELEAEIARVETEIIRKEATRDHAENLFRKD